jgi:hypothetical protein
MYQPGRLPLHSQQPQLPSLSMAHAAPRIEPVAGEEGTRIVRSVACALSASVLVKGSTAAHGNDDASQEIECAHVRLPGWRAGGQNRRPTSDPSLKEKRESGGSSSSTTTKRMDEVAGDIEHATPALRAIITREPLLRCDATSPSAANYTSPVWKTTTTTTTTITNDGRRRH